MPSIVVWEDKSAGATSPGEPASSKSDDTPPLLHFSHAQGPFKKQPGLLEDSFRWPEIICDTVKEPE